MAAFDLKVLFVILISCTPAFTLYFYIGETEKKCFIEDIPDETLVVGNYKVEMFDREQKIYVPSPEGLGMHVDVRDPEEKSLMSRTYASEGRFTFSSSIPGEHIICLYANSSAWFGGSMLRVHLSITVGERANDYEMIAARDKLSDLELRVRQLVEQTEQIRKEQNYQRMREMIFRDTSESTNMRVLWWSIIQTILLLIIGLWQIQHLRSFFEAKKLV